MRIFYTRCSTANRKSGLAGQIEGAKALGIEDDHVFAELVSGANTANRPRLKECLRFLRKGDVLICTKLDRLARSMTDLADILKTVEAKGANLKVLDQREIDTTTPNGRLLFGILAAVAYPDPRIGGRRVRTNQLLPPEQLDWSSAADPTSLVRICG